MPCLWFAVWEMCRNSQFLLSNSKLRSIPFVQTLFDIRSLSVAAHTLRHSLLPALSPESFRHHLKTHYFQPA